MGILLVEFIDVDNDPIEIEGDWEITSNCLIYYVDGRKSDKTIIPLYNIFRMKQYKD